MLRRLIMDRRSTGAGPAPLLAAPDATGKEVAPMHDPSDPSNWPKEKKRSFQVVNLLGMSLALDFTMSLMSIQALYYILGGPNNLYGLTFGAYDLTAMVFAPLFGAWHDSTGRFKPQSWLGIACSVAGNVVYGLSMFIGGWWALLLARLVAGIGAALMATGSTYITSTTTSGQRTYFLARYRISQTVARSVGPFVGYALLGLPSPWAAPPVTKVFNWYTLPGWLAALVVLAIGAAFVARFVEPTEDNGHLAPRCGGSKAAAVAAAAPQKAADDAPAVGTAGDGPAGAAAQDGGGGKPAAAVAAQQGPAWDHSEHQEQQAPGSFASMAMWVLPLTFLASLSEWAFFANSFAMFAGQFHGVTSQMEQWKTFVGQGAGAVAGALAWRLMARRVANLERPAMVFSLALLLPAWLLVIPYAGPTEILPVWRYYAASVLSGFSLTVMSASFEAFASRKLTQHADTMSRHVGKVMGVLFMGMAGGRFAGPLIAGSATHLGSSLTGGPLCEGPPEQQCCIEAETYAVSGCVLIHAQPFFATMAALTGALIVCATLLVRRHGKY